MNMKFVMLIMIVMVAAVLFAGHWFLYYSWDYFFQIENCAVSKTLIIILSILSVSFLVTLFLVHWRENFITSWAYMLSASWTGIVWYLTLATVLIWFIDWAAFFTTIDIHIAIIAFIMYGIALAYSGYGIWNARFPRVNRISIEVKNLPQAWYGRKVVLLTDIHLGAIHHIRFARRVVGMIQKLSPDMVLVGGDIYDGAGKELGLLAMPFKDLKPQLGMYGVIGNHETYINIGQALKAIKETGIQLLRNEQIDIEGVQIVGVDYHMPNEKRNILKALDLIDNNKPTIAIYHEPVVKSIDAMRAAGADVVLAGHTHQGQMWPFDFITRAIFKNYNCGLYVDGDFSQYTSSGVGTWGPPLRTGNKPEIVEIIFEQKT